MPAPPLDLADATELLDLAQSVIDGALVALRDSGGIDAHQSLAYDVAHAASALATARASLAYARNGDSRVPTRGGVPGDRPQRPRDARPRT